MNFAGIFWLHSHMLYLESEEDLAYMKAPGILSLFIQMHMWIESRFLIKLSMGRMSMRKSRLGRVDCVSTDKRNQQAWNETRFAILPTVFVKDRFSGPPHQMFELHSRNNNLPKIS